MGAGLILFKYGQASGWKLYDVDLKESKEKYDIINYIYVH